MGEGSQRSLDVGEKKEVKPGVLGNMMGPEDGLRGEGQTLECVTKG